MRSDKIVQVNAKTGIRLTESVVAMIILRATHHTISNRQTRNMV